MAPAQTSDQTAPPEVCHGQPGRRFTLDGGKRLENFLAQICQEVGQEIQKWIPADRLEAVLLGGGYGRGEGGVLRTPNGERPYNDLEFYVFIRGNTCLNERRWGTVLQEHAERLSVRAGIHVELKILSLAKLRHSPISMFYYDLMSGHRCIIGQDELFRGCKHHTRACQIPMAEAARLLMNRFSGVLFAREELRLESYTRESHDFIVRNLAKAKLALGDAILTAHGLYHWSCPERHRRLEELLGQPKAARQFVPPEPTPSPLPGEELESGAENEAPLQGGAGGGFRGSMRETPSRDSPHEPIPHPAIIRQFHAYGTEFKLHPRYTEDLWSGLHARCVELLEVGRDLWLWLENRRLKRSFASIRDYAFDRSNKCPETHPWRNRLVNARLFGPSFLFRGRASRHPRERLLNALPVLLWELTAAQQLDLLQLLRSELGSDSSSPADFAVAYRDLWRKFN